MQDIMKLKKYSYIIILLLTLTIGINRIYAGNQDCYYISADKKQVAKHQVVKYKMSYYNVTTKEEENMLEIVNKSISSNKKDKWDEITNLRYPSLKSEVCPTLFVYRTIKYESGIIPPRSEMWGFENEADAENFKSQSTAQEGTMPSTGSKIAEVIIIELKYDKNMTKKEYDSYRRGKTPSNGKENANNGNNLNNNGNNSNNNGNTGTAENVDCETLFGDKNNPESLRYLIDKILMYPRIMVPILVILLGSIDLAKAVIAGNEDEMKKAQKTFVKRIVIGVAFFLIPVLIDILMSLADIVWAGQYSTACRI